VLVESGVDTNPEQLSPQVYLPERHGSLQIELLAATRRAGRIPYVLPAADPRSLIAQIESGRPVLILQNLRTRSFPAWHYAVLVGFVPDTNRVHLHSGTQRDMSMGASGFLRTWDWGGRWAMVVLKPGELPAMAEPGRYAEAAAAFDTVADFPAAELAWQAAADHWPNDPRPRLALGNLDYRYGDIFGAIDHFQAGLAIDSQDPALVNNLASVLGDWVVACAKPCYSPGEASVINQLEVSRRPAELAAGRIRVLLRIQTGVGENPIGDEPRSFSAEPNSVDCVNNKCLGLRIPRAPGLLIGRNYELLKILPGDVLQSGGNLKRRRRFRAGTKSASTQPRIRRCNE
jgi:hypothetical protein